MKTNAIIFFFILLISLAGCQNQTMQETPVSGHTTIVVDESLAPIVQEEYDVFRSLYSQASIDFIYQPENKLLSTFLSNKVNIAIMSRKLLPQEAKVFESRNIKIRYNRFAIDAISLIVNRSVVDSTITVQDLLSAIKGENGRKLVFDNANSSTVRYLKELSGVKTLTAKNLFALNSNAEVIKYVYNNKGAIGVIGFNWIKSPTADLETIVKDIKVLKVKNLDGKPGSDKFYSPSQNNLALGVYPLNRDLYIVNCQGSAGLGTGFASFLASDPGQRIVLKSGLMPDSLPTREILIK